jgi:hypothetical protein
MLAANRRSVYPLADIPALLMITTTIAACGGREFAV